MIPRREFDRKVKNTCEARRIERVTVTVGNCYFFVWRKLVIFSLLSIMMKD